MFVFGSRCWPTECIVFWTFKLEYLGHIINYLSLVVIVPFKCLVGTELRVVEMVLRSSSLYLFTGIPSSATGERPFITWGVSVHAVQFTSDAFCGTNTTSDSSAQIFHFFFFFLCFEGPEVVQRENALLSLGACLCWSNHQPRCVANPPLQQFIVFI
jgi:hypothetical protein